MQEMAGWYFYIQKEKTDYRMYEFNLYFYTRTNKI
ncbi:Uncharacterised protein [Sphingobacterium spiritivorum]|nr:Uncharacterised protein [Sphingobacterium spiritivorum]